MVGGSKDKSHVRVPLFGGPVKALSVLHRSVSEAEVGTLRVDSFPIGSTWNSFFQ